MSLSPREQEILTGIEDELGKDAPALVAAFRTDIPASITQTFPIPARHVGLLLLALLTLIILHSLDLQLGLGGSVLLTAMLIVPWMVSASRAVERRRLATTATASGPLGHATNVRNEQEKRSGERHGHI